MNPRIATLAIAFLVAFVLAGLWQQRPLAPPTWSSDDIAVIQSLSLSALVELPADPSNAVANDPAAAALGAKLFFDPRLSANGAISCATCHQPIRRFTDGLPKGQAIGTAKRNTPSIVGVAYSPWLYWDGRRDSLWAQALAPLEDANEHGTNREQVAALMSEDEEYDTQYRAVFGEPPERFSQQAVTRTFVNVGKAIAAFERTVMPTASRFDEYVAALSVHDEARQAALMSSEELWGLRLFIGAANCTQCHNGPLLTNNEFHNTGVLNFPGETPDKGRVEGIRLARSNEFRCTSDFNDDPDRRCDELQFARTGIEVLGTHRVPSLRNLENTAPYMHKGQLSTLAAVLQHYNEAPEAMIGHNEAKPLNLSDRELQQLESFLLTLAAPAASLLDQ